MKILIISAISLLSVSAFGQVGFSAKAHLLFPVGTPSWKNISNAGMAAYDQNGKNNIGFNAGLSSKINLPLSFYIMPELYFTTFKNEITDPNTNTKLEAKTDRIDLPVLVGYNFWGDTLSAFLGPVASYNLSSKNTYRDFEENAKNDFTVGIQFGAQAKISKFIIDARYEGAFTNDQREFINKSISGYDYTVRYDNRPSHFMLGVGYNF